MIDKNTNGEMERLLALQSAAEVRNTEAGIEQRLLLDMVDNHPALRLHLLGHSSDALTVHSGSITIARVGRHVRLRLHKPALSYQATFLGCGWAELLEVAETALANGSDCWEQDWTLQRKQRLAEQRELDK